LGLATTTPLSRFELGSGQIAVPRGLVGTPSYSFGGDLNTGIYSSGDAQLAFSVDAVRQAFFNGAGLNMDKQIFAITGTAGSPSISLGVANSAGLYQRTTNTLDFSTAGTFRATLDASGNLGIGTTTPVDRLQVVGNTTQGITLATSDYNQGVSGSRLNMKLGAATGATFSSIDATQFSGPGGAVLALNASGGRVGVGTSTPSRVFHVVSPGNDFVFAMTNTGTNGGTWNISPTDDNFTGPGGGKFIITAGNAANSILTMTASNSNTGIASTSPTARFVVKGAGTGAGSLANFTDSNNLSRFSVTDGGNIGFNTASPASTLHLNGYTGAADFRITAFSDNLKSFKLEISNEDAFIKAPSDYGNGTLAFWTNNTEKAKIIANGNFGIGTSTPATKLGVLSTATQLRLSYSSALYTSLFTNSSGNFSIVPTGNNTGIGTTTPSATLHVQGSGSIVPFKVSSSTGSSMFEMDADGSLWVNGSAGSAGQVLQSNGSTAFPTWVTPSSGGTLDWVVETGGLRTSTSTDYAKAANFIATSTTATSTFAGAVGIGTTTPSKLFTVFGDQTGGIMRVHRRNASTNGILGTQDILGESLGSASDGFGVAQTFSILDTSGTINIAGDVAGMWSGADNVGKLNLRAYYQGAADTILSLDANDGSFTFSNGITGTIAKLLGTGQFGIGTTTPGSLLTVAGTSLVTGHSSFLSSVSIGTTTALTELNIADPSAAATIRLTSGTSTIVQGFAQTSLVNSRLEFGTLSAHSLNFFTNNSQKMVIESGGNVGIGDATPSYLFTVGSGDLLGVDSSGNLELGSAGVRLSADGDGAITFLGLGDGSDESITMNLDDTSNTLTWSSATGITLIESPSITTQSAIFRTSAVGTQTTPTYSFSADTNSGMYKNGSGDINRIGFTTNGTGRLFIDENGGVGIGTSSTAYTLNVLGNSYAGLLNLASSTGSSVFSVNGAGNIVTGGGTPSVSSCGTSPSVSGNDTAGTVTVGSGVVLSCTITFSTARANTPRIVGVVTGGGLNVTGGYSAKSTTAVTFSFAATVGAGTFDYFIVE
jgi:hypothetical protein